MATLGLKEMGKFLSEGRGKGLSCFFKPKVANSHSKVHWENEKKSLVRIMKSGLEAIEFGNISFINVIVSLVTVICSKSSIIIY